MGAISIATNIFLTTDILRGLLSCKAATLPVGGLRCNLHEQFLHTCIDGGIIGYLLVHVYERNLGFAYRCGKLWQEQLAVKAICLAYAPAQQHAPDSSTYLLFWNSYHKPCTTAHNSAITIFKVHNGTQRICHHATPATEKGIYSIAAAQFLKLV